MKTAGYFFEFPTPTMGVVPLGIGLGADGNIWFTEFQGNNVGRVNFQPPYILTSLSITEFPIPSASTQPIYIAPGPASDHHLWVSESANFKLAYIDSSAATPVVIETSAPYTNWRGVVAANTSVFYVNQNNDSVEQFNPVAFSFGGSGRTQRRLHPEPDRPRQRRRSVGRVPRDTSRPARRSGEPRGRGSTRNDHQSGYGDYERTRQCHLVYGGIRIHDRPNLTRRRFCTHGNPDPERSRSGRHRASERRRDLVCRTEHLKSRTDRRDDARRRRIRRPLPEPFRINSFKVQMAGSGLPRARPAKSAACSCRNSIA